MALTPKGRLVFGLFLLLGLGCGGYYLYYNNEPDALTFTGIWNRLVGGSALSNTKPLTDTETKAAILESILKNTELRSQTIHVEVSEKAVSLKGDVDTPLQRAALEQLAKGLAGARAVESGVNVRATPGGNVPPAPDDADVRLPKEVEFALYKTDAFEVKTLKITCQNRTVRLGGNVRNIAEKILAERITREVPDVHGVINELEIP